MSADRNHVSGAGAIRGILTPVATPLPEGTITLLFTDIEGSTALLHRLGDGYATVLADQRALLRGAFAKWNGHEVDHQGDSFFVVFARAGDAVASAADAQRALQSHQWPEGEAVRVRMGLHTGEPQLRSTGYVGMDVHRGARIAAAGHGGQILLSQTTHDIVCDSLPAGTGIRDLGNHRFKDLDRAHRTFQLVVPGLPATFPPLRSLDARPNNLPVQPTPLLGRDDVLGAAREMLLQNDARLLTMVGPGGVGKTRLGLQLAAEVSDDFPDGVYFVALAPVRSPALVLSTIAHTLGVREHGHVPTFDLLVQRLHRQRILLLLDNFEHVIDTAGSISELLAACPGIRCIVTSREPLRLRTERQFPVPTLPLPELGAAPMDLASNPAVELFVQRGRAAQPSFTLSADVASAVADICVQLAGLPLAIELAAARTKFLSPPAIRQRLAQSSALGWLTGGPRDAPDRHRTLQASIAWSYELLSEQEREAFRRLGVFVGGFTLAAAEMQEVTSEPVASLLDKSLIQRDDTAAGDEPRFSMLEVVREYARQCASASGELRVIEQRHADVFVNLALEAEPHLEMEAADQRVWLDRLEKDRANVRAALHWAIDTRAVPSALRLGHALSHYWFLRGYMNEGRAMLDVLLALPGVDQHADLLALVLDRAGVLAAYQSDFERALQLTGRCLEIRRALADRAGVAETLANLSYVRLHRGDFDGAAEASRESLAIVQEIGSDHGRADALSNLALIADLRGTPGDGRPLAVESLREWEELGSQQGVAWALYVLGSIDVSLVDYDSGRRCFVRSLALSIDLPFVWGIAFSLEGLARLAVEEQQHEKAFILAGAAEARRRTVAIPLPAVAATAMHRVLTRAREVLSEASALAAFARGERLDDAELIAWLKEDGVL